MRLLNKDTSPFHTPAVQLPNGKLAPSVALPRGTPVEIDEVHAHALARHSVIADRIRRGILVDADADERRSAERAQQPTELAVARGEIAKASKRIAELEAQLAATASTKTKAEAAKAIADLTTENEALREKVAHLEADLAEATAPAAPKTTADEG